MILGIDEAGRGPVIGPMVICGVFIARSRQKLLRDLGVRDSKSFGSTEQARRRRAQLAAQIRRLATRITIMTIDALEVDRRARLGELNLLEQEMARAIIESGPPVERIIADGARLFGSLCADFPQLKALDRADERSVVVSAASIMAKVERDARFEQIAAGFPQELEPTCGGGYVNKATGEFLRAYFERFGELPAEVRRSWSWAPLREIDRRLAGLPPLMRAEQLTLPSTEPCIEPSIEPSTETALEAAGIGGERKAAGTRRTR